MGEQRDPYPYLARVPAGAVRDSLRLLWDQIHALKSGAAGAALTLTSVPYALLVMSGNQTIADATPTVVTWGTIQEQQGGLVTQANAGQITIPRDTPALSIWLVTIAIRWATSAAGIRQLDFLYNDAGGANALASVTDNPVAGTNTQQELTYVLIGPDPGTFLTAQVTQTSGGPLDVETSQSAFTLVRLY